MEQKNQVEQALKQRLTPLLHTGEAWQMNWDQEPLPTDNDFAVKLLKANLQARGRGGFMGRARLLSPRGGRGSFAGVFSQPDQQQIHQSSTTGFGSPPGQEQGRFVEISQRGRGVLGARGRGRGGTFGGRQPLLHR